MCRGNINPPPYANYTYTNYDAVEDEMIDRAPIESASGVFCESFKIDNKSVWDHLADILWDTKVWVNIKEHQRTRDGRVVFLPLKDFILDPTW